MNGDTNELDWRLQTFECVRFWGDCLVLGRSRGTCFVDEMITGSHVSNIAGWDKSVAVLSVWRSTRRYRYVSGCFWTSAAVAVVGPGVQGGCWKSKYWMQPLLSSSRSFLRVLLRGTQTFSKGGVLESRHSFFAGWGTAKKNSDGQFVLLCNPMDGPSICVLTRLCTELGTGKEKTVEAKARSTSKFWTCLSEKCFSHAYNGSQAKVWFKTCIHSTYLVVHNDNLICIDITSSQGKWEKLWGIMPLPLRLSLSSTLGYRRSE